MPSVTRVDEAALPDECWCDPARGSIRFRTLLSAPQTPTSELVCGVARMVAGDSFALHSHPQSEVYFGLEGEGQVMVDGVPQQLAPGVALYIPGGAVHGVPMATGPLKWFYTFATDSFDAIRYSFIHEAGERHD